jgi:hypothetical protein
MITSKCISIAINNVNNSKSLNAYDGAQTLGAATVLLRDFASMCCCAAARNALRLDAADCFYIQKFICARIVKKIQHFVFKKQKKM